MWTVHPSESINVKNLIVTNLYWTNPPAYTRDNKSRVDLVYFEIASMIIQSIFVFY